MNKKLCEEKSAIEAEYTLKRDELLREQNMSSVNLTAMAKVLDEIKTLTEKISTQKHERAVLEEELNETQFSRTKLEQKVKIAK